MPKIKKEKNNVSYVPYSKGFRPPTQKQQLDAIGYKNGTRPWSIFSPQMFDPIPKCTSQDDWLAQYQEEGQTYEDFLHQCPWFSTRKRRNMPQHFNPNGHNIPEKYPEGAIYILPLGGIEAYKKVDFPSLVEYTKIFFGLPVKTLPAVDIKVENGNIYWVNSLKVNGRRSVRPGVPHPGEERLRSRYNKQSGHIQLCVDTGLLRLKEYMPNDAICMIALTMLDLYAEPSDLFVAGMAAGNHRVAIFSLNRYNPNIQFSREFWHTIKPAKKHNEQESKRLMLQRGCRLVVHEIAHLLGVDHCVYFSCCMNGSGHLEEDFRQPMYLCPVDLRKLHTLCGFDSIERYKKLLQFYTTHKLTEEKDWVQNRLEFIATSKIAE